MCKFNFQFYCSQLVFALSKEWTAPFHFNLHSPGQSDAAYLVKIFIRGSHLFPGLVEQLDANAEEFRKGAVMGEEHGMEIMAVFARCGWKQQNPLTKCRHESCRFWKQKFHFVKFKSDRRLFVCACCNFVNSVYFSLLLIHFFFVCFAIIVADVWLLISIRESAANSCPTIRKRSKGAVLLSGSKGIMFKVNKKNNKFSHLPIKNCATLQNNIKIFFNPKTIWTKKTTVLPKQMRYFILMIRMDSVLMQTRRVDTK